MQKLGEKVSLVIDYVSMLGLLHPMHNVATNREMSPQSSDHRGVTYFCSRAGGKRALSLTGGTSQAQTQNIRKMSEAAPVQLLPTIRPSKLRQPFGRNPDRHSSGAVPRAMAAVPFPIEERYTHDCNSPRVRGAHNPHRR